jgi:glycosyltransferase involved in cell wall biosynthesis
MKILYFGIYSKGVEYPRNNNIINGLRLNGADVIETHFNLASSFRQRFQLAQSIFAFMSFCFKLALSYFVLVWKYIKTPGIDVVIVGHPGYFHIHLARFLARASRSKPRVIYDVFIPLYDAVVIDRKLIKAGTITSKMLHKFEALCCQCADICLIDTREHCAYLVEEFKLPSERVFPIYVGPTITNKYASPISPTTDKFTVAYVGTYIPLHGVDIILEAARELQAEEDISFHLIGSGQMQAEMKARVNRWGLKNVSFRDWVLTDQLGDVIRSYDLSLGVFGVTPKTFRVIPSKVYDICAAGVPFITADTPAIREVFTHKKNAYLVPPGNPHELTEAILTLKNDPELRLRISQSSFETGKSTFSLKQIGNALLKIIHEHLSKT